MMDFQPVESFITALATLTYPNSVILYTCTLIQYVISLPSPLPCFFFVFCFLFSFSFFLLFPFSFSFSHMFYSTTWMLDLYCMVP